MTNNFFTLFSLPPVFKLDLGALAEKKRQLLAHAHPDAAQTKEIPASAELINQAYQTLASPDARAAHLLELSGEQTDLGASIGDLDFLQDALELREDLGDADDDGELDAIKQSTCDWLARLENDFAAAFEAKNFTDASDVARKMAFLVKLLADIGSAYDDLDNLDLDNLDDALGLSADLF